MGNHIRLLYVVLILSMANAILFGQPFAAEKGIFKLQAEENIARTVSQWHFFKDQVVAESGTGWWVLNEKQWHAESDYLKSVFSRNGDYVARLSPVAGLLCAIVGSDR